MKVWQVSFDTSLLTILLDDNKNLIDVLIEKDDNFKDIGGKIYYCFSDNYNEECIVKDVTNKRGIIQYESH